MLLVLRAFCLSGLRIKTVNSKKNISVLLNISSAELVNMATILMDLFTKVKVIAIYYDCEQCSKHIL